MILTSVMHVERLPYVLHCLCMVPSLLLLVHISCMIISFAIYYQCKTLSFLLLVKSPSDCVTFIIHNSLFFIDTLFLWCLHLWILYLCINGKITICTEFSMIGSLPDSTRTCRFTWMITTLLGIYFLIVRLFLFK